MSGAASKQPTPSAVMVNKLLFMVENPPVGMREVS
jgi:hypothetical protein